METSETPKLAQVLDTCRRSLGRPRAGFPFGVLSRPLHVRAKNSIHPALIARALVPKPIEDIAIHAQRNGDLRRHNQFCLIPEVVWQVAQLSGSSPPNRRVRNPA